MRIFPHQYRVSPIDAANFVQLFQQADLPILPLSRAAFSSWTQQFAAQEVAGRRGDCVLCPLANYLGSLPLAQWQAWGLAQRPGRIEVRAGYIVLLPPGFRPNKDTLDAFRLPPWARQLIMSIDGEIGPTCLFDQLTTYLAQQVSHADL